MENKIRGLTLVAPPEPFPSEPFTRLKSAGAGWVAVVPYAYTPPGKAEVVYGLDNWQWWGEKPEGAQTTIRMAREHGLQVMLKPQVWIPRGWTGSLDFNTEEEWAAWEQQYQAFVLEYADMAQKEGVDLFCLATEFRNAIRKRPAFWQKLIRDVKEIYRGELVYSANWDDWQDFPFWNEMDYIGLSAYFPLVQADTPAVQTLCDAWKPICQKLGDYAAHAGKPVLFTEFGYLSVDNCGWRTWELESGIRQRNINEQAQANCYEAFFLTFSQQNWWAGGFVWKWFPNLRGHEGYPERDYTPQDKLAEQVLMRYWNARR